MSFNELEDQFNYIRYGIARPKHCDLSSYLTLKSKGKETVDDTHITTDKSRNQMKE